MRRVRASKTKLITCSFGGVILASMGLALAGEFAAMLAWWMAIALLLPPLLWALKTRYVTLITICSLAFATQFITLPFFYLNRDDFAWGHVKPFGFTAWEAFPMLAKVSLFLFALIVFFRWFHRLSVLGGSTRKQGTNLSQTSTCEISSAQHQIVNLDFKTRRKPGLYPLLIVLVIATIVPLNLWMFSQGLSIVGVQPPEMPYKLAGILHYFIKFIIPLLLAYLYYKSKQGWLLMLLLLAYAWILGISTVSRNSLMYVMLPVLYLAWLDRRRLMLCVAGAGLIVGYGIITLLRGYVYIVTNGKTGAIMDSGLCNILLNIISVPDSIQLEYNYFLKIVLSIFERISGFYTLVMSQYYDLYEVVSGPLDLILRMVWRGLVPIDADLHHIQWQGNVLPAGFFNGGGLLANTVILGNAGIWWVVISAMVAAVTLVILEKSTKHVVMKYKAPAIYSTVIIGFLSMNYYISNGNPITFVYPFVLLFIASWLPPVFPSYNLRLSKTKALGQTP